ncbi:MAG: DNA primase [Acidimicrobiales bacterium]
MGILPEDVARVRAGSDLVQIASEHIGLKRVGRRYVGLCPFHAEKTPSFSVNPAEGLYYCFGCGASGDVITWVREVEHLDFADAVERLAARAGVQLRYDDAAASAERQRRTALVDALRRAVDWYHERLLSAPDAVPARHYLRAERGYDGEVVRAYRLGWAPDGWDTLARALRLPDDVLRDSGLGFVNARGRQQDGFRARVVFPIFDVRDDPVALGGRTLPGGPPPKYRNSPETPLYKKSRTLYGLNWAKGTVVKAGEAVVCEGYTDVIALHAAGVEQAVATCGTALGDDHVQLLKNFAPRLVLAYDADAAGQAAAARVYEWEQRYEIDVAVAALPPGQDPADLGRRDPEALRQAVAQARPFLAFRLERVLAAADLRSNEGRARAAETALGVVAEHPSELVRDQYVMQVADRTGIDPDRLRERLARRGREGPGAELRSEGRSGPGGRRGDDGPPDGSQPERRQPVLRLPPPPEMEALLVAVHRPEEVADCLHEVLFEAGMGREAYRALASSATLHEAIETADEHVAGLLQRLAVEEETAADPIDPLARLAERAARRVLASGDASVEPMVPWLKAVVSDTRDPTTARDATERLVRWLAERLADPSLRLEGRSGQT